MGSRALSPLCSACRWREAGGGDRSWEEAGGSSGVTAAQENRGFQREPRGRAHGNDGKGPLEVTECSQSCPAEGIQRFRAHIRTSDCAQQPSQWINPPISR